MERRLRVVALLGRFAKWWDQFQRRVGLGVLGIFIFLLFGGASALAYWTTSDLSNFFSARAIGTSLSAPTTPVATVNGGGAITVSWTLPGSQLSGAQYQVVRTAPGAATTVCLVASSSTSCQNTGLTPSTLYSYSVTAVLSNWTSSAITTSATTSTPTFTVTVASGPYVAGSSFSVTQIQAKIGGVVDTTYSGTRTLTWSSLSTSPLGNTPLYPSSSVVFVNGVATSVGSATTYAAGTNTLRATDAAAAGVSGTATITTLTSSTSRLGFTTSPSASTSGYAFPTQPQVTVEDAYGNTITSDFSSASLAITAGTPASGGPGTLSGCTQGESLGVISFAGCKITTTGMAYTLTATDGVLVSAVSGTFNVAGTATQLVIATPPASSSVNVAFPTQPVIDVEDANGNIVTGDVSTVTLAIVGGTPTIGGPGTMSGCVGSEVNGVVTFTGCKINAAGGGYQLQASDGLLTPATTGSFNIAGAATHVAVLTTPSGASGGTAFSTQPKVAIEDVYNSFVTNDASSVVLSITTGTPSSGGPGALSGCAQNESLGVVTFTGCKINTSGTAYSLTATDGSLTSSASGTFNVTVGPAVSLVTGISPAGANGGSAFSTQPAFYVEDAGGNLVTSDSSTVSLSITSGTPSSGGPGTLSGCSQGEVAGVIVFSGCSIDLKGSGYSLTAVDGSLSSTTTSAFNVNVGPAAQLNVVTSPLSATGGTAFGTQAVVWVEDAGGNIVTTDASTVSLAITAGTPLTGGPGVLSGCSQAEVSGVVTFSGCKISTAGTGYTLTASDGALAPDISDPFNVTVGSATKLAFVTSPSGASGGTAFGTQPVVAVEDAGGNIVTTDSSSITVSITTGTPATGGPGTLSGCTPSESLGVFSITGCTIDKAGTSYTLSASDGSLSTGISSVFNVSVGAATHLVVTTSPAGASGGTAFVTQPVVKVEDAGGNVVTTDSSTVSLTITPGTPASGGPGTLSGCTPSEVAGVVNFAGCKITTSGTAYSLTASDGSLASAVTSTFNVTVGPAAKLVVTTSPAGAFGGAPFATQPVVAVEDAGGNIVTSDFSSVTLAITAGTPATGGPGTLTGCSSSESGGVFTLLGCKINTAGTAYSLSATDGSLTSGVSSTFNVTVGAASQLVVTTSPAGATGGVKFTTQPVVKVEDAGGNVVTTDSSVLSLAITSGTPSSGGPGTLSGCSSVEASGVFTVSNCLINTAGTAYSLTATDGSLTPGVSNTFNVTVGPATKLAFTTTPGAATSGVVFGTQPVVVLEDAGGNIATGSSTSVTLATNSGTGTLLCTTNPLTSVAGYATFAGCKITLGTDGSFTLKASASGLSTATSGSFTVFGVATKVVFTTQPTSSTGGSPITVQPVVKIEDAANGVIPNSSAAVTLSIASGTGTLTGCTANPVTAVAGIATFAGCTVTLGTQGNFTLSAASSGLTSATSSAFTVAGAATKLAFTTQPSSTTGGVVIPTQPIVKVEDSSGDVVTISTASVTLAIASGTGTLSGCSANPVTAVAGAATFAGCTINLGTQGNFTLSGASSGLTSTTSSAFTVAGAATKLAFTTQPTSSTGGVVMVTQPVVKIEDSSGDVVTNGTASVTLAIASGTGTLSCTTNPVTAVNGAATFAGCKITLGTQGNFTLSATASGLTSATSATFSVAGAATQVVVTTSPGASTGAVAFTTQPVVKVEDSSGDLVNNSTVSITLAISTGSGTLACTTNPLAAVAGAASFAGCKITLGTQGNFSLLATASGLSSGTSSVFSVAGTATQLVFGTQPTNSTGGSNLTVQPVVKIEDSSGDVVTNNTTSVTLAIASGSGTLTCTTNPLAAVAGVATFAGCKITLGTQGVFTLSASGASLTSVTSNLFTVAGTKSQIVFAAQPGASSSGTVFSVQPIAYIEDSSGDIETTLAQSTTLAINTGTGTLLCTTNPVTSVAGVATFAGCKITLGTQGVFTLKLTGSGVTTAVSSSFTVAGAASKLVFSVAPAGAVHGTPFTTQPVVLVEDSSGDVVTTSSIAVTLSITSGTGTSGAVLTCTANPLTATSGSASFAGCAIDLVGTNYTLTATGSGVTSAVSASFNNT